MASPPPSRRQLQRAVIFKAPRVSHTVRPHLAILPQHQVCDPSLMSGDSRFGPSHQLGPQAHYEIAHSHAAAPRRAHLPAARPHRLHRRNGPTSSGGPFRIPQIVARYFR